MNVFFRRFSHKTSEIVGSPWSFIAALGIIVIWALTAAVQAFSACLYATLYFYLRREKEGVDIEQIASVFD